MLKRTVLWITLTIGIISPESHAFPLRVIQFNTWGVPFMVEDSYRYQEAMRELEQRAPDLIILEEVFSPRGKRAFHSALYPYEASGPRGFPKLISSGLRILSKYPITKTARISFRTCTGADCLARKGALLVVLELPEGLKLNVVATHLDAGHLVNIRLKQMAQIRDLIAQEAEENAPILIAGDFNFGERSIEYPRMLEMLEARDSWHDLNLDSDAGSTYDAFANRYAHDYSIKTGEPLIRDRIDFLLTRNGSSITLQPKTARIIFNTEPLFSDHYGIEEELSLDSISFGPLQ